MSLSTSISGGGGGTSGGAGTGDVVGPASSTDNAVARFNGAGGKTLQDSVVTVGDLGEVAGVTVLDVDALRLDGNTISSTDANEDILLDPNGTGDVEVVSGNLLLANPLAVAEGGTGAVTLGDAGVLIGNGTGAVQVTAAGTAGQVLTSNGAGVDPTFQDAAAGSGDFVGPASSTDNAIVRFDSTTGKLGQDSGVTVADVTGASVTVATTAGNALVVEVTEPAAANGASVAGKALALNAGDAVASLDTAGAAAGGSVTIAAGVAARLTSGNANGGDVALTAGTGIGTGTRGEVQAVGLRLSLSNGSQTYKLTPGTSDVALYGSDGTTYADFAANDLSAYSGANRKAILFSSGSPPRLGLTSDAQVAWANSTSESAGAGDVGVARNAAAVLRVTNGSTGLGSTLTSRLVEANTAGVGSPNVLTANESRSLFTNEGSTAANHHALPAAAAGLEMAFYVQDSDGIVITAAAGDTIRVAGGVSSAGGTASNSTVGGFIQLIAINATEWVAGATQGTWVLA